MNRYRQMEFDLLTPYNVYYCWQKDSSKTFIMKFMPELLELYVQPPEDCLKLLFVPDENKNPLEVIDTSIYDLYMRGSNNRGVYAPIGCIYCTERGTKDKPPGWPTPHL